MNSPHATTVNPLDQDMANSHGMTMAGRVLRDAWVFGLLPEGDGFAGRSVGQWQLLFDQVAEAWEVHGQLPSRLPPDLADKHARIHGEAMAQAIAQGWSAELSDDD